MRHYLGFGKEDLSLIFPALPPALLGASRDIPRLSPIVGLPRWGIGLHPEQIHKPTQMASLNSLLWPFPPSSFWVFCVLWDCVFCGTVGLPIIQLLLDS